MYSAGVQAYFTAAKPWPRLLLALATVASGCGGATNAKPDAFDGGFNRAALVEHLVNNLLVPIQEAFLVRANELPGVVQAYCTALDTGADATVPRAAAQIAWANAVDAWQR
nr:hypothetical protein [Kofleriaceae bacterium]